ncbi:MAG TPA: 2-succinyl-5-enolpyruvyl-6-hydroxy-3-cyclohexene-1-carboxylic-acid synthase [Actinomycetota bacterium]
MSGGDLNLRCAWALVDELVRAGVHHACLSPGSRSTPLALAIARHPEVEVHTYLDERASGFTALGLAKTRQRAVAIVCTSGTAAAELLPAVVEASQARVPLAILTADRPPRLRGTGANQTIDQAGLYGRFVRASLEPPVPASDEDEPGWASAGRDAIVAMTSLPIGPVHVNCPFDEPLTPGSVDLPSPGPRRERPPGPKPWEDRVTPEDVDRVAHAISGRRGVIVAGSRTWEDNGRVGHLAERLGWPMLAEPLSGLRRPGAALSAGQALLGARDWLDAHRPEVALQVGATPTARATQALVASAELIVVDVHNLDPDPEHHASVRVDAQPDDLVGAVLGRRVEPAPFGWLTEWEVADERARAALDRVLDGEPQPSGVGIARDLAAAIPAGGILLAGNSLPVRDLDLTMTPRDDLRVLGNRGASGIDGLVSTAIGAAASRRGSTYALLGDLAFVYDLGALGWAARHDPPGLTIVVVDNRGGRVFSDLPQRDLPEFEDLFLMPHEADLEALTLATGADHVSVRQASGLAVAVREPATGIRVVVVPVDPEHDRSVRARIEEAVAQAVDTLP